jgi:hypothetical protein
MTTIRDIHTPWRDALLPAMFDGCPFFAEAGSQSGGRRIVVHQFPKRDFPYAEDMGRRATEFLVRGYVIQYGSNMSQQDYENENLIEMGIAPPTDSYLHMFPLFLKDYRIARDKLQQRLDLGGDGVLQLPNSARAQAGGTLTMSVVCTQYRMTEEDKFGGYCVFDMNFVEFGKPASIPQASTVAALTQAADGTYSKITSNITAGPPGPTP